MKPFLQRISLLLLVALASASGFAQTTKLTASRLILPGGNSTFLTTTAGGAVAFGDLASLVSAGTGTTVSGNSIGVSTQLQALHNLTGTGQVIRTGTNTFTVRTETAGTDGSGLGITIADGDGVAGNPTFSVQTGALAWKRAARAVSTSNITLSGTQTIDGVSVIAGDIVLVAGQSTASANGPYVVAAGSWTRAVFADAAAEFEGQVLYVREGTAGGGSMWALTTTGAITVGSTSLTYKRLGRANQVTAGTYGSATQVPVFTINDDGTISSVTNTTITHPALTAGDGSGSDRTIILGSPGSGTVTLAQGSGITLSRTGNTITIAASASAPTISIARYEEIATGGQTTVTVSGFTPLTTNTLVFLDGVQMDWGAGEDITLSGSTITFLTALVAGQKVVVKQITAS